MGQSSSKAARVVPIEEEQQEAAARAVQRSWRSVMRPRRTAAVLDTYLRVVPSIDWGHAATSVDALWQRLKEPEAEEAAHALLSRVYGLCARVCPPDSPESPRGPVRAKVFLAAYLVVCQTERVFEHVGPPERAFLAASTQMLDTFRRMVAAMQSGRAGHYGGIMRDLGARFVVELYHFEDCYKAWKEPDAKKLLGRIRHLLAGLYESLRQLPPVEPGDGPATRPGILCQIQQLRLKMQLICGKEALEAFDAEAPPPPDLEEAAAAGRAGDADPFASKRWTNEEIAHELLLDPGFRFRQDECDGNSHPAYRLVRDQMRSAFWESLVGDLRLEPTPCYVRVVRVLREVGRLLVDLRATLAAEVAALVDVDAIMTRVSQGEHTWDECKGVVAHVLALVERVQGLERVEETREGWAAVSAQLAAAGDRSSQAQAFCEALKFLFSRVSALRVDAANARIPVIAPIVAQHGRDYERTKLRDKLRAGQLTLDRTREWLAGAVRREMGVYSVALCDLISPLPEARDRLLARALVALVVERGASHTLESLPETFRFDVARLNRMACEYRYLVLAAAILVTADHALDRGEYVELRQAMAQRLLALAPHDGVQPAVVAGLAELARAHDVADAVTTPLLQRLGQCLVQGDAVSQLLGARLRAFVSRTVVEGTGSPALQLVGASVALAPRVEKLASDVRRLCEVNCGVHYAVYYPIITAEAARAHTAAQPGN